MPEMTGLELLQHMKREGIRIPTIIITAHGERLICEHCKAAGAVAFLPKPFEKQSLLAAIDTAEQTKGGVGRG